MKHLKDWVMHGIYHREIEQIGKYSLVEMYYKGNEEIYAFGVFKTKSNSFVANYSSFGKKHLISVARSRAVNRIEKLNSRL